MALLKRDRSFWSAEILSSLRKVGYHKPTLLQLRVVPLIMKGKDLAVEAVGGSGKTAAFILPLVLKLRRGKPGIKALVLTKDLETSRKITYEFRKFSKLGKGNFSVYALGADGSNNPGSVEYGRPTSSRKERNILSSGPDVLIGTPDRVIDHIRRGNLHFKSLQTVIIDEPEQQAGFSHDVLFIYSKFPPRKQTVLFSPGFQDKTGPLLALLRRPILLNGSVWKAPRIKESFIPVGVSLASPTTEGIFKRKRSLREGRSANSIQSDRSGNNLSTSCQKNKILRDYCTYSVDTDTRSGYSASRSIRPDTRNSVNPVNQAVR